MSVQFMRPALYRLVLALLFAGSIPWAALATDQPKSIDDLDPENRRRFEQLRNELRQVSQKVEDAKKRAYAADPLLLTAKEGIERSRELQRAALKVNVKVKQFLAGEAADVQREYKRWMAWYGIIVGYDITKELFDDPEMQAMYTALCRKEGGDPLANLSKSVKDLIKDELPAPGTKVTEERIRELYLLALERTRDEYAAKIPELEDKLKPPAFMYEYKKKLAESHILLGFCDAYYRLVMPEDVAESEKDVKSRTNELMSQLDSIWPGWAEAELRESELSRSQKALSGPAGDGGTGRTSSLRVLLSLASLLMVVAVFAYYQSRKRRST